MLMKTLFLAYSLLFTQHLGAQTGRELLAQQIKEARSITDRWLSLKNKGLEKRDLYEGQAERASYIISGIPKYVSEVNPRGVTYRHYVGSNMQIILETKQLKTGITPYVVMSPGFSREVYQDLVGIFLTTPQTPPERVGLPRNSSADYIDFTLYEGTPVVEIEKEILLIPGRPDLPAWLKTLYLDYKETGRADHQYVELFQRVNDRGGINPTFMKVNIQSYRMAGKIYFP